jgi:hypothetical protein
MFHVQLKAAGCANISAPASAALCMMVTRFWKRVAWLCVRADQGEKAVQNADAAAAMAESRAVV